MLLLLMVTALPVGVLAARLGAGAGRFAPSVAGALLLAIVIGDLVPDALHDASSSDLPGGVTLVVAVAAVAAVVGASVLGRRGAAGRAVGCCSDATGRVAATALATHGAAEGLVAGLVVGTGIGPGDAAALAVAGVVALHRVAEGFALATALCRSRTPRGSAGGLVALAALSPLLGGALAGVVTLDEGVAAVVTAALAGLLSAVAVSLLVGAWRRAPALPRVFATPLVTTGVEPGTPS